MALTSKDVDKLLRAEVWPYVREQGFVVRGRTARRYWHDAVDIVNVQSYSAHVADVHGMTSCSFQVNLAVWPTFRPPDGRAPGRDDQGRLLVDEWQCLFRHHVEPTVPKPLRRRSRNPFPLRPLPAPTGTFEIAGDGANALDCVRDARRGLEAQALPWFAARRTVAQMLTLIDPGDHYTLGFAAAHTGDAAAARRHLELALDTGAYDEFGLDEPIRAALAQLDGT